MYSPVSTSLQISKWNTLNPQPFSTLIKWWFRYFDDVHSATRNNQVNKFQEHISSIHQQIKFSIELPGTDGFPFLETLTKHTPHCIESTVYRKPTDTGRYLDYSSNHTIQQNYLLYTLSSTALNMYVLHLNSLEKKWITLTKS